MNTTIDLTGEYVQEVPTEKVNRENSKVKNLAKQTSRKFAAQEKEMGKIGKFWQQHERQMEERWKSGEAKKPKLSKLKKKNEVVDLTEFVRPRFLLDSIAESEQTVL